MKIIFRVDASHLIGSGHVMRCLAIAEGLDEKGYDILFACSPLEGDMREFIRTSGFKLITLSKPQKTIKPLHDADYESWLQKSTVEDAQDFITSVTSVDLVVTDHYAIGAEWHELVVSALNCYLFAIDDLGRCHKADLVLDQTLGRSEKDYTQPNTRILIGSEYALLRSDFGRKREAAFSRRLSNTPLKLLVSMGGVDAPNATCKVLETLSDQFNAEITVLLSKKSPNFQEVKALCSMQSNMRHQEFVHDMASLMLEHDFAIGAPGTSSWERACLGLPNIVIPIAKNQKFICEQLVKHKAAVHLDIRDIKSKLHGACQQVLQNWSQYKEANLSLCDGRGARRVIFEIEQLLKKNHDGISLRYASQDDSAIVYNWQTHPDTRRYALNPDFPK